ncbi:hypothetical protein PO002_42150 [Cupriavidus necator]|uniref:hypothetical protein n=1 Tax=Cupriavidus necator TaxID=106590 RepID=UPI0039C1E3DD
MQGVLQEVLFSQVIGLVEGGPAPTAKEEQGEEPGAPAASLNPHDGNHGNGGN